MDEVEKSALANRGLRIDNEVGMKDKTFIWERLPLLPRHSGVDST